MRRRRVHGFLPAALPVLLTLVALAACNKAGSPAAAGTAAPATQAAASAPVLLLAPEDLRTVAASGRALGPVITGSIQPEKRADLRAEVSAVVLQVVKENGDPVQQGDLIVRLDDTAIRDSLASAEEATRAAQQAHEQAGRQVARLKTLQDQGMISMTALEDAEIRRNNAQSELAAARARAVSARQMLRRTEVRAPFAGIVSDRKVSAGDTAQIGKELVKVIDPSSMRFEGLVTADRMHEIKLGQAVGFRVSGYPGQQFSGTVRRVDAAANTMTRQVEVLVGFAAKDGPQTAGLYAEGRIETSSGAATGPSLPEAAVQRTADAAYVWRVKGNQLGKVPVELGPRDARRGEYPLLGGLADGDRILRNPGANLVDGQRVEFASTTASNAASAPDGS